MALFITHLAQSRHSRSSALNTRRPFRAGAIRKPCSVRKLSLANGDERMSWKPRTFLASPRPHPHRDLCSANMLALTQKPMSARDAAHRGQLCYAPRRSHRDYDETSALTAMGQLEYLARPSGSGCETKTSNSPPRPAEASKVSD